MSAGIAAPLTRPAVAYLQDPRRLALVLGSFGALTVPLCLLALFHRDYFLNSPWPLVYVWALGITHFVLTVTVYLQSANLRYFLSSRRNQILYFVIPAGIFVFFVLYYTLQAAVYVPLLGLLVPVAIRLFDFYHFGRQSFGVSQLLKAGAGGAFPTWQRRAEQFCFLGFTLLLWLTFMSPDKRFDATRPGVLPVAVLVGIVWLTVVAGLVWSRRPVPLAYFLLQSCSATLAIYSTSLYAFCLAIHYVEYHLLMAPRCFTVALDERSRVDRFFARLRQHKAVFYSVLLAVAAVALYCGLLGMGMMGDRFRATGTPPQVLLVALFDGLFVFHYFVESLIWRFSDPYYRKNLGPLYFPGRA
jgi:hypothetical protein